MSEPELQNQPLIGTPSQQTGEDAEAPGRGHRSTRAYKVAGFTLLGAVLIAGQALTAYFLLTQRNDIKALEQQSNQLKTDMTKGSSYSVPMRMDSPMNTMTELLDDSPDEVASTGSPEKSASLTTCQLEAYGLKPVQVPGFVPACDGNGQYRAQQCFQTACWCVNQANGKLIPGSMRKGPVSCNTAVFSGRLMPLSQLDE
ncbi:CD74 molecule, major histocompatibility complex, class II invariant chain b [Pholidichthys leucotaenia]